MKTGLGITIFLIVFGCAVVQAKQRSLPPAGTGHTRPTLGAPSVEDQDVQKLEYSLRTVKRVWRSDENPVFVLDVHNVGNLPVVVGELDLPPDSSRPTSKSFGILRLLFGGNDKKSTNPNIRYCPVFTEPYDEPVEVATGEKVSLEFEMTEMAELHSPKLKLPLTPGRYEVGMGYIDNHLKTILKTNIAVVEILPTGVANKNLLREFLKPYGAGSTKIQAGFIPAANCVKIGDPVNISFVVENLTEDPYTFAFGGDYRATARHDRFKVLIYDEHDQLLDDPRRPVWHYFQSCRSKCLARWGFTYGPNRTSPQYVDRSY